MFARISAACFLSAFLFSPVSSMAAEIATHRALYRLAMVPGTGDGGIVGVDGGMTFEWGESCDGWTVEQRYVMRFEQSTGGDFTIATDYVTWESKDGLEYRFNVKQRSDGAETSVMSGSARLDSKGGGGFAQFDLPTADKIALPRGTVFPTEHSLILLDKAAAGKRFDRSFVFDGSEAEGAAPASTVILRQRPADSGVNLQAPLGPDPVWPMKIAFYAVQGTVRQGEELPDLEMSMDIQENGVVTGLTIVFNDATVRGTLERVEAIASPDC